MAQAPAPPLKIKRSDRHRLEKMASSTSLPYRSVREAKGLLMAVDGVANARIAKELGVSRSTVIEWREHFVRDGIKWVGKVHEGRGRKTSIDQGDVEKMIRDTQESKPDDSTHWSTRSMAKHSGMSKSKVQQIWSARKIKPHLTKTFKISKDKNFESKLVDVVGLYLHPPKNSVVLSFDEKSQIQALDRTQPSLPMRPGRAGTMTHDYKRNGTTTLFAGLDMATGELIGRCYDRHRHEEFLAFLKIIDRKIAKVKDIHIILDNYATHKHENVKKWLDKHKRFHLHFTPTSSSWLNMVERWFGNITDKMIRRGVFRSVKQLVSEIGDFIKINNEHPKPYVWTKTVDQILAKVRRGRIALDLQQARVI